MFNKCLIVLAAMLFITTMIVDAKDSEIGKACVIDNIKFVKMPSVMLYDIKELPRVEIIMENNHAVERFANWVIDHFDSVDGWSLTGWSRSGEDKNNNSWNLHIGLINGRMDYETELYNEQQRSWGLLEDWNRERKAVFGLYFIKEI